MGKNQLKWAKMGQNGKNKQIWPKFNSSEIFNQYGSNGVKCWIMRSSLVLANDKIGRKNKWGLKRQATEMAKWQKN